MQGKNIYPAYRIVGVKFNPIGIPIAIGIIFGINLWVKGGAMAMKCLVVAANVGGVPEVVLDGETGVLVPLKDPVQLARGIVRLFKNPFLAKQMAECGYQR